MALGIRRWEQGRNRENGCADHQRVYPIRDNGSDGHFGQEGKDEIILTMLMGQVHTSPLGSHIEVVHAGDPCQVLGDVMPCQDTDGQDDQDSQQGYPTPAGHG